jgi:hypothetical protein
VQHKHIFSLLDDSFTTATVVFGKATIELIAKDVGPRPWGGNKPPGNDPSLVQEAPSQQFTYKVPKDSGLKAGDAVVVDSPRNGLVIARVHEVHDYPKLDLDSDIEYKWIVQKVDVSDYVANLEREAKFREALVEVERAKQR